MTSDETWLDCNTAGLTEQQTQSFLHMEGKMNSIIAVMKKSSHFTDMTPLCFFLFSLFFLHPLLLLFPFLCLSSLPIYLFQIFLFFFLLFPFFPICFLFFLIFPYSFFLFLSFFFFFLSLLFLFFLFTFSPFLSIVFFLFFTILICSFFLSPNSLSPLFFRFSFLSLKKNTMS